MEAGRERENKKSQKNRLEKYETKKKEFNKRITEEWRYRIPFGNPIRIQCFGFNFFFSFSRFFFVVVISDSVFMYSIETIFALFFLLLLVRSIVYE